jgi:hypothetical protein
MWLDVVWIALGLIFLIAVMALILNPPEKWVKRFFLGKASQRKKRPGSES